jgi:hypothetical protein
MEHTDHVLASMPESPPPAPAPTTMWICTPRLTSYTVSQLMPVAKSQVHQRATSQAVCVKSFVSLGVAHGGLRADA